MKKVLYICTHNRCRSILFEAITNHTFGEKIQAKSAGSQPVGEVYPMTLHTLNQAGISTHGLKSQSWDQLESFAPDLVITVCDSAAGESCPVWFGQAKRLHWGIVDPSKLQNEYESQLAFHKTISEIQEKIQQLPIILKEITQTQTEEAGV
ncbi:arsenate reductase ArsC [Algicola sagamiensis]|uniref:arsenate reductase ArsC n=1 Tax=Algicola sagamiensis TaxID=163869 RepID=UPI00036BE6F8|nr:arsenate reductase ArsC [Algicola sagamiensis]